MLYSVIFVNYDQSFRLLTSDLARALLPMAGRPARETPAGDFAPVSQSVSTPAATVPSQLSNYSPGSPFTTQEPRQERQAH